MGFKEKFDISEQTDGVISDMKPAVWGKGGEMRFEDQLRIGFLSHIGELHSTPC